MPADLNSQRKFQIQTALADLQSGDFSEKSAALFQTLGYGSRRTPRLADKTARGLLETYDLEQKFRRAEAKIESWKSADILFQITDAEVKDALSGQKPIDFDSPETAINNKIIQSYLFLAVELGEPKPSEKEWTRADLATITREINKLFPMPALVLFKHGGLASLGLTNRRINKTDTTRDVVEQKVTLIKDIRLDAPHRAHIEILSDLSLQNLRETEKVANFVELDAAWRKVLNVTKLNERFYRELANWFFYARENVEFPLTQTQGEKSVAVIRLITRLIFAYFVREKGLVPSQFFLPREIPNLLNDTAPDSGSYYNAILQNLFFATLATEKIERGWLDETKKRNAGEYLDASKRRYRSMFRAPDEAEHLFNQVPFLNGGLFECLDKRDKKTDSETRQDGFSTTVKKRAFVPNRLFFSQTEEKIEAETELRAAYEMPKARFKPIAPLLDVLGRYKFTIAENTPVEEEVALDPELLGKVFENLLAFYNPETHETARKQFGAFFTPREIVDYMIEEALVAFLVTKQPEIEAEQIRALVSYDAEIPAFDPAQSRALIDEIGGISILDPACGSGAFPMGALQRLTHVLKRLDKDGKLWEQRQRDQIASLDLGEVSEAAEKRLNQAIAYDGGNYVRKLYLIEKSLFGIDIQPIAVQIAKLRFFISLVVEQTAADSDSVQPLPNLETKIVAANALLSFQWPENRSIFAAEELETLEKRLSDVRRRHFRAQRWRDKIKLREQDETLREEIGALLQKEGLSKITAAEITRWNPYDQNARAELFHPEWMFGKEMRGGFSMVIGNPPYVRADFQGGDYKKQRARILADGEFETLYEKWDLFIPFIERSFQLLAPGGVTTMIVADAYAHAKYGLKSREWFLKNSRVLSLDLMSEVKIFDAAVRNVIYFYQKADGQQNVPRRRLHSAKNEEQFNTPNFVQILPSKPQAELTERAFFPGEVGESEFETPTVELEKICYISYGLAPNADERRFKGDFVTEDVVSDFQDETHPKKYIEGKDIRQWHTDKHRFLEWGTERAPEKFRRQTFVELHEAPEKLMTIVVTGGQPPVMLDTNKRFTTHTSCIFVLWHSLENVVNRSIQKSARYGTQVGEMPVREELEKLSRGFEVKYLLAVMNSTFAREFLRSNRRSNIHLYPDDWKLLPIAVASAAQQELVCQVVNWILTEKQAATLSQVTEPRDAVRLAFWEQVADALVWELFYPSQFAQGRSVFRALEDSQPATTSGRAELALADLPHLLNYFKFVYEPSHPLREAIFFLDSVPAVRKALGK